MRILFLSPSGTRGGAEISLCNLVKGLRAAKPDWRIGVLLGQDGPVAGELRSAGAEVIDEPFPAAIGRLGDHALKRPSGFRLGRMTVRMTRAVAAMWTYERRLRQAIADFGPDVVHTNGFKMHVLGVRCAPAATPVVWHIRDFVSNRAIMARLLRWYAGRCAMAIANSRSVERDVLAVCGDQVKTSAILNAVNVDEFTPDGAKLDLDALSAGADRQATSATSPTSDVIRVGLLATFARWKGHTTFLKAIAELPSDLPVRGYIIGGPVYQTEGSQHSIDELRAEAERLGLGKRVGFTGYISDRAAAMRALDIVVHASTEPEPFGLVIIEAMSCARPVIVANAGGAGELAADGKGALAHTPGDSADLARQIATLASDPGLRRRVASEGRAKVLANFQQQRLVTEVLEMYEKVASKRALAASA